MFITQKSTEMIKRKYIHCGEKDKMMMWMNKNVKKNPKTEL